MTRASRGFRPSCWSSVSGHTKTTHLLARMLDRIGIPTRHVSVLGAGKLEFDLEDPVDDLSMALCARSKGALPCFESFCDERKPPTIH